METKSIVITLDGPAGAGKSTVAKGLARRLGMTYLDTGAMYRALTLKAMRERIDLANEGELVKLAQRTTINFNKIADGSLRVTLDGVDVEEAIRSVEVTNNTFYIARCPGVREMMVTWQREIASDKSIVTDGRDQGTVVFPHATYKFYVDAHVDERVERRARDLKAAGKDVDLEQLKIDIIERDKKDFNRAVGPLKKAHDAIEIDSSGLDVDGTVEKILKYIK